MVQFSVSTPLGTVFATYAWPGQVIRDTTNTHDQEAWPGAPNGTNHLHVSVPLPTITGPSDTATALTD